MGADAGISLALALVLLSILVLVAVRLTSSRQRMCRHDLHLCVAAAGAGVQYGHHLVGTVGRVLDHGVINGEHLIADR